MTGMEVNAGEPFNTENRTVVQLITWLQGQDQNSRVEPENGESLIFRKLRNHDGGQIQVSVEKSPRRRKRGSQVEKALEDQEVSASDDPAAAAHVTQEVKDSRSKRSTKSEEDEKHEQTKKNQDKQMDEHEDSILGVNQGHDQGGVVPGTSKTPSDKPQDVSGKTVK